MTTTRRFILTFATDAGRRLSFSIPRPNATKHPNDVESSMLDLASIGIIATAGQGIAQTPYRAKLRTVERTPIV